jgi:hypothetical protein
MIAWDKQGFKACSVLNRLEPSGMFFAIIFFKTILMSIFNSLYLQMETSGAAGKGRLAINRVGGGGGSKMPCKLMPHPHDFQSLTMPPAPPPQMQPQMQPMWCYVNLPCSLLNRKIYIIIN